MISKQDMLDLGFEVVGIFRDGGTLQFINKQDTIMVTVYATNPSRKDDPLIKIKTLNSNTMDNYKETGKFVYPFDTVYSDECDNIEKLQSLLINLKLSLTETNNE